MSPRNGFPGMVKILLMISRAWVTEFALKKTQARQTNEKIRMELRARWSLGRLRSPTSLGPWTLVRRRIGRDEEDPV